MPHSFKSVPLHIYEGTGAIYTLWQFRIVRWFLPICNFLCASLGYFTKQVLGTLIKCITGPVY